MMGDDEKAIADFSKVIDLDPKRVSAYCERAGGFLHKGDVDQAIVDCEKAMGLNPK